MSEMEMERNRRPGGDEDNRDGSSGMPQEAKHLQSQRQFGVGGKRPPIILAGELSMRAHVFRAVLVPKYPKTRFPPSKWSL